MTSTSRRGAMLALAGAGAAIAAPVAAISVDAGASWDRAVHKWRIACARWEGFQNVGPYYAANRDFDVTVHDLKLQYGSADKAKTDANGSRIFEKAWATLTATEEENLSYATSADNAAKAVIRTPSPDIDAVHTKIRIAKEHSLMEDLGDELWQIITSDLKRLEA